MAERAAGLLLISVHHVRVIPTDDEFHLRAVALQSAIEEDIANGKIPFFVSST